MIILVLGIAFFVFYLINKISETSNNPKEARHRALILVGIICIVLDEINKGFGSIIFILFLLGYGWFKLYDK